MGVSHFARRAAFRAVLGCMAAVASVILVTGASSFAAPVPMGFPTRFPGAVNGVSAVSASEAWAVGDYFNAHWDGAGWTQMANPQNTDSLNAVSAISPATVWAVGSYLTSTHVERALLLRWNGTGWTRVTSPQPGAHGDVLTGVSTVSASDAWAVGYYIARTYELRKALVLHWDGTRWTQVASPQPGPHDTLFAVTAIAPSNIWAVGSYGVGIAQKTLVLHWNGARWTQVASPAPGSNSELAAVAAISRSDIWAAGNYDTSAGAAKTLVLHWNGTRWTRIASPAPTSVSVLQGVAATSSSNAWAVGYYLRRGSIWTTLVLHWNGASWTRTAAPSPGLGRNSFNGLLGVSARSSSDAWAVGAFTDISTGTGSLILRWNGTHWTLS